MHKDREHDLPTASALTDSHTLAEHCGRLDCVETHAKNDVTELEDRAEVEGHQMMTPQESWIQRVRMSWPERVEIPDWCNLFAQDAEAPQEVPHHQAWEQNREDALMQEQANREDEEHNRLHPADDEESDGEGSGPHEAVGTVGRLRNGDERRVA